MNTRTTWRWSSLLVVLAMIVSMAAMTVSAQPTPAYEGAAQAAPAQQPPPPDAKKAPEPVHPTAPLPSSTEEALKKLHPDLRELAQTASPALPEQVGMLAGPAPEPVMVEIFAEEGAELSRYFVDGKFIARNPLRKGDLKTQTFIGLVYPTDLLKIASLATVQAVIPIVLERNAEPDPYPPDQPREIPKKGPEDWAKLRANAEALRAGSLPWDQAKAFGDGRPDIRPADWFEVMPEGPHQAQDAWERGYKGEGVTVAVLDDGIDPAHPDLLGTQKIYSSTLAPQYNGWPYVFSPISMLVYALDKSYGTTYIANGYPGVHYVDTSATPTPYPCGTGLRCFQYDPLIDYGVRYSEVYGVVPTYVFSATMSKSGVIHVGTHPDNDLRDFLWGEKVAVLLTDPNVAGVYDTVYVDLDADHEFMDEKSVTRADVNDPDTYNNMIAYRDLNGDGLADISGGMVYFIADGVNHIPGFNWMYSPSSYFIPPKASLVAFSGSTFDRSYSHGTQCASNIVGQGRTSAMLPTFSAPLGDVKPDGAVFGMAPKAKVVNISDIYYNFSSSILDAYIFAAVGYDACDQTGYNVLTRGSCTDTDGIQITTNSYGESAVDNDGWDYEGQVVSQLQRWWAPYLQFLFSTGNGAPGYGTAAPPSPATGIGVGASTEFGSTGWDSITSTTQIMFNDVIPFSNRGPSARGTNAVDVVAGGAYAAGAEELNYYSVDMWGEPDGNRSWVSWGGTSRSAPVAGGVLALIYQAYKEANGDWPTYDIARALLKASATDLNYDTFTQGAGSVNADRGTAVAGGHYGVFALPDEWNPGDYRGTDWPGFAHIVYPGDVFTQTIAVVNPSTATINVDISDAELVRIGSEEFTFTVTPQMVAAESAYGAANRDNFFKAFNYFIPITATEGMDSSWYKVPIPPDTDLMIVRQMYPFGQFDVNGDYTWDNRFYLTVYNWKDVNGDGNVWEDKNGNGVVNFINDPTTFGEQADGAMELAWNDPRTELDRWEFGRFGYNRPAGNVYEMWVHDPLERMHDGLFIGLRHLYNANAVNITTTLRYRIDFYKKTDVAWLETSTNQLTVPAGDVATFVVTATVPTDMPAGEYQAGIYIADPGITGQYEANTTVIPVAMSVAAPFTDGMVLGGMAAYDEDRPYNNGAVRGDFEWTWRAESGDWRFFFTDVADGSYPADTSFIVKDEWDSAAPYTDIDTIVLGPTPSRMGSGSYDFSEPSFYGPYVLDTVAKSPNTNVSAGIWRFNTSSGANEDWVIGPLQSGLHAFLQHNVLFQGDKFWVPFTKTVGTLAEFPHSFSINTYLDAGLVGTATLTATLNLNGLQATGFLIAPEVTEWTNEPLGFTGSGTIEWTYVFNVSSAYYLEIWTSSADIQDLDLYLYRRVGNAWQQVASSAGPDANESIYLSAPPDGLYLIGIDNYSGPAGHFNMTLRIGKNVGGITVVGATTDPVPANTPVSLGIYYDYPMEPGKCYDGLVLAGPPEAPELKEIPLEICRQPESAGLEKTVDYETAFPGDELQYTLRLFNYSDPGAFFELTDPIPEGTEFVTVTGQSCVVLPGVTYLTENFDSATPPALPAGWDQVDVSDTVGNWATATATVHPSGQPPHSAPNLAYFNSYLASSGNSTRLYRTTGLDLSAAAAVQLSFWMYHDTGFTTADDRIQVQVSTDGGTNWVDVGAPIPRYDGSTGWKQHVVDLSAYAGQPDVRLGFLGISAFGNDCHIDDVVVSAPPTTVCYRPTYDSLHNTVVYTGPLPLATVIVPPKAEGFEGGVVPPAGWSEQIQNTGYNWSISTTYRRTGTYGAYVPWNSNQNEWLLSPRLLGVTGGMTTSLWSEGSVYWCRDTYDNCDLNVWLVVNDVGGGDDILLGKAEDSWPGNWTWTRSVFTLPATLPAGDLRIGYQYVGDDGADAGIDDIHLPGTPEVIILPSAVFTITVRVTDTVAPGTYITNTAALVARHTLPQETQAEEPVEASAVTHIGAEDFATSYKDAPAEVVAGDTFVYEVHVTNSGDALAYVTLTDTLPAGLTYVSHWSVPNSPYYTYNPVQRQLQWAGNIAPGEEWVFYVEVRAGTAPSLWDTTVRNTAYILWDGNRMPLVSPETRIVPPYRVYLPLTLRNYGP